MGVACPSSARSVREALCDTPLQTAQIARAVAASASRARQESVPIKKAAPAKKTPAKKAPLKAVDVPPGEEGCSATPVVDEDR
jgi:hypothetical protein